MSFWARSIFALGCCFIVGCGSSAPQWRVVSQAHPNQLTAKTPFVVQAPTFEGAQVDGAPLDTLAAQGAAQRDAWLYDFTQIDGAFRGSVIENTAGLSVSGQPGAAGAHVVHLRIVRIGTVRANPEDPHTEVEADVTLLDPAGRTLDEIVVDVSVEANIDAELEARRTERFRKVGIALGKTTAAYLRKRTGLE